MRVGWLGWAGVLGECPQEEDPLGKRAKQTVWAWVGAWALYKLRVLSIYLGFCMSTHCKRAEGGCSQQQGRAVAERGVLSDAQCWMQALECFSISGSEYINAQMIIRPSILFSNDLKELLRHCFNISENT